MDGTDIGIAVVIALGAATAIWIYGDSRTIAKLAPADVVPVSPFIYIALCVFGFWIIGLPLYLSARRDLLSKVRK